MDSIKPTYQFVRFECPSCGHVWTSSEAIERTDAAWLRFCGSPQVICPQCHGHSDPGDCFCGFHDDGLAWIDPAVTPHPPVCGDEEVVNDGAEWVLKQGRFRAEDLVKCDDENDPHGRDPEEGTSRPYPWEGRGTVEVIIATGGTVAFDPSVPVGAGDGGPEFFIPVSPIGVPPAPDCGIIDDLEETE